MAFKLITYSVLVMVGFMNPESQAKASTQFRYIITETSAPSSLDPLDADNTANLPVARMIYATPLEAAVNNQLTSRILESFRYDAENRRIEWKVKPGIKYEDGTPLTADDVAFAVARMAYTRPKFPVIEAVDGLNDWIKAKSALKTFPKGITVSDNVVRIQFARTVDHPLFRFCLELFSIIPRKCVDSATNKITCTEIPESGLYKIAAQDQKQITFVKRTGVSEPSAPSQIKFEYKTPTELAAELGKLDDATVVAGNESFFAPGILHDLEGKLSVRYTPAARFSVIQINQSVGPFNDKKCRQLFAKTFRESYREIAKGSPVEGSVFTKILPGYLSLKDLEGDGALSASEIQRCKDKLAKGTFPWGYAEPERDAIFFQALSRTFETLGIKATKPIVKQTRKEFSDQFSEGKVAFFNAGSGFWALDPAGDMKMLLTPNLHKPLKHVSDDEKLQTLIGQLSSSSSTYAKVNRYLFEEARFNVYTHVRRFFAAKNKNLLGDVPFAITSPAPWQVFRVD